MMAFEGIRSTLTETVNVTESGLLLKLLDDKVINRRERQFVKVLHKFCVTVVMLVYYLISRFTHIALISPLLSLPQEFIVYFVLPLNCLITVYC